MTVEELKKEAAKLGYSIIKKQEYIRFKPCICGCNNRKHWYSYGNSVFFECTNCGLKSPIGLDEKEAKLNWNKMIEEKQNDRKQ